MTAVNLYLVAVSYPNGNLNVLYTNTRQNQTTYEGESVYSFLAHGPQHSKL